jgi:putative component of membrane protein insertase Oxa1/YidC/SpoIIIJ protein YidD
MLENLHPPGNSQGITEDDIIKNLFSTPNRAAKQNLNFCLENLREPRILSLSWLVLRVLALYRRSFLHEWLHKKGYSCRFIPSCTNYCERAIKKYGAWQGIKLTVSRLRRCNLQYRGSYVDFP